MTTGVVPQFHRKWHVNDDEWRLTSEAPAQKPCRVQDGKSRRIRTELAPKTSHVMAGKAAGLGFGALWLVLRLAF